MSFMSDKSHLSEVNLDSDWLCPSPFNSILDKKGCSENIAGYNDSSLPSFSILDINKSEDDFEKIEADIQDTLFRNLNLQEELTLTKDKLQKSEERMKALENELLCERSSICTSVCLCNFILSKSYTSEKYLSLLKNVRDHHLQQIQQKDFKLKNCLHRYQNPENDEVTNAGTDPGVLQTKLSELKLLNEHLKKQIKSLSKNFVMEHEKRMQAEKHLEQLNNKFKELQNQNVILKHQISCLHQDFVTERQIKSCLKANLDYQEQCKCSCQKSPDFHNTKFSTSNRVNDVLIARGAETSNPSCPSHYCLTNPVFIDPNLRSPSWLITSCDQKNKLSVGRLPSFRTDCHLPSNVECDGV